MAHIVQGLFTKRSPPTNTSVIGRRYVNTVQNQHRDTIVTPRSAHLPQVVRFHEQGRARFLVRHVLASIAMTLHMLHGGTLPTDRDARR
jgi:hypothetical protein